MVDKHLVFKGSHKNKVTSYDFTLATTNFASGDDTKLIYDIRDDDISHPNLGLCLSFMDAGVLFFWSYGTGAMVGRQDASVL